MDVLVDAAPRRLPTPLRLQLPRGARQSHAARAVRCAERTRATWPEKAAAAVWAVVWALVWAAVARRFATSAAARAHATCTLHELGHCAAARPLRRPCAARAGGGCARRSPASTLSSCTPRHVYLEAAPRRHLLPATPPLARRRASASCSSPPLSRVAPPSPARWCRVACCGCRHHEGPRRRTRWPPSTAASQLMYCTLVYRQAVVSS